MTDDPIKTAVAALQSKYEELMAERQRVGRRLLEDAIRHQEIQRDLDGCIAGAKALGGLVVRWEGMPNLSTSQETNAYTFLINARTQIAQQFPHLRDFFNIPKDDEEAPESDSTDDRANMPRIADIIHARLAKAGEKGSKAAEIRSHILDTYDVDIHDKTVSMTLNRLQKEGSVRREGHIWFSASPDAEKPGEDSAGLQ